MKAFEDNGFYDLFDAWYVFCYLDTRLAITDIYSCAHLFDSASKKPNISKVVDLDSLKPEDQDPAQEREHEDSNDSEIGPGRKRSRRDRIEDRKARYSNYLQATVRISCGLGIV